ncbi:hypothetical protein ABTD15_19555, partial [Acinetobacter baumannii]
CAASLSSRSHESEERWEMDRVRRSPNHRPAHRGSRQNTIALCRCALYACLARTLPRTFSARSLRFS